VQIGVVNKPWKACCNWNMNCTNNVLVLLVWWMDMGSSESKNRCVFVNCDCDYACDIIWWIIRTNLGVLGNNVSTKRGEINHEELCIMNTLRVTRAELEIRPLCVVELLWVVLMHYQVTIENVKVYCCSNAKCRYWKKWFGKTLLNEHVSMFVLVMMNDKWSVIRWGSMSS